MLVQLLAFAGLILGISVPPSSFTVEARYVKGKENRVVGMVRVDNGEVATVEEHSQEPFVTEVEMIRGSNGARHLKPTVTILTAGISLKVKVRERDLHEITHDKVFVDVTAEVAEIGNVEVKRLNDKPEADSAANAGDDTTAVQSPTVQTKQTRLLAPATLGKPISIPIGDGKQESIEITVRR